MKDKELLEMKFSNLRPIIKTLQDIVTIKVASKGRQKSGLCGKELMCTGLKNFSAWERVYDNFMFSQM